MFKHYFKIALRNLVKHKTYSFIHIFGLTVGIACLVLILKYVQYEMSFDRFNENADHIYRITGHDWAQTPVPLSEELRLFYPEITNTVRIRKVDKVLLGHDQKKFYEENVVFSDPSIFNMFTFPLLVGDPQTVLNDPYSVVITQETARKYFGDQDPIGKKLNYDDRIDYTVTGILKRIPQNSHMKFDFVFSLGSAQTAFYKDFFENRMNTVVFNYFQLNTESNLAVIQARLDEFTKSYLGEGFYNTTREGKWRIEYHLQPLLSIHLHSNLGGEFEPNGDITSVYIFSAIAILILLIACINYMNLSTARYMNRLREVGIRKVLGASRRHIIYQFIGESVSFSVISIFFAFVLIELLSPWLSTTLGEKGMYSGSGSGFIFPLIGIALLTGLLSGSYPAIFLSRFHPVHILSKTILKINKRFNYRNGLILFQFVVSTVLIIATLIVNSQLSYIQKKKLGFNKEQIVVLPLQDKSVRMKSRLLKNELLQQPGIVNATLSSIVPGAVKWVRSFNWEGQTEDEDNTMSYIATDYDFLKTYKIQMLEGRDFSESFSTDEEQGFLINQAALKKLGWDSAIGKKIGAVEKQGNVIGLVKDFHFKSLHEKIEPLVIYIDKSDNSEYMSVRLKTNNVASVLNSIQNKWKDFSTDKPFEYFFLDDYWGKLYMAEQSMKNLFSFFSALAIFIACLGLFGLAAFSIQNKTKEIGIRKVLGASVPEIISKLSIEFTKWVVVANVIAWPVAYYFMTNWLQDFAYRIEISWWAFLLAGGIALVIALATVSFQAIKAAIANPVESLRYE
ncbi:MAG: ABC transporter permease [Ignavibacteria bacterium]